MKLTAIFWKIFIITGICVGSLPLALAYRTPIIAELKFNRNKPYYRCKEKVSVTITVKNTSLKPIILNKGIVKNRRIFLKMRIIDPAGRLVVPRVDTPSDEFPDAPPLPYVEDPDTNKLVMAAPCEKFMPGPPLKREGDLRKYYNFEMAGWYTAQVQLSVLEFEKQSICNPKKYKWLGVIESKTRPFFIDGRIPIQIRPDVWHLAWKDRDPGRNVAVQINIPAGNTFKDFQKKIRLQDLFQESFLEANAEKYKGMLIAKFKGKECIQKLKHSRVRHSYQILISGKYANGRPFCGVQRITIK